MDHGTVDTELRSPMKRSLVNLIVDIIAAVSLLVMVLTGYIIKFPLPPTTNRSYELWGMSRHEWGSIHAWAGVALMAILIVHLILHWDWIFSMIRRRFTTSKAPPKQRLRVGLITLVALVGTGGLFAWVTETSVQDSEAPRRHLNRRQETVTIESTAITPIPTATPQEVDFKRDIYPIFAASCIDCHGPRRARSNFRVDQRETFFSKSDAEPLIVPGNSGKSRLIAIVSGEVKNMKSAQDHLLPSRELALLKSWIDAGADWGQSE